MAVKQHPVEAVRTADPLTLHRPRLCYAAMKSLLLGAEVLAFRFL
jgi:hypothetical protein